MSQENVELSHRANDAFNRRDLDAFLALMDPGVEFTPYERAIQGLGPLLRACSCPKLVGRVVLTRQGLDTVLAATRHEWRACAAVRRLPRMVLNDQGR
jgi:hypothetical protein